MMGYAMLCCDLLCLLVCCAGMDLVLCLCAALAWTWCCAALVCCGGMDLVLGLYGLVGLV